jgi:mannose/fructose/N-acetylgalactosamine-specific phosphotransferase system component IID
MAGRTLLLQAVWNFERLQNAGFAFAIDPWLVSRWRDARELERARERHLGYFNTQPYMASFALGAACRLEEVLADVPGYRRREGELRAAKFKEILGSALAALGDALFWGALRPFLVVLAVSIFALLSRLGVKPAWPWAVAAFLVPYNAAALWVRWSALGQGYELGERLPAALARLPFKSTARALRLAGTGLGLALLAATFFDPAGLGPVPAVGLAAVCAGLLRLKAEARGVYLGTLAFGVAAAAAGLRLY